MKKILVTRKLLEENNARINKIFDVKLNEDDKLYNHDQLLDLSKGCDGILSFTTTLLNKEIIDKLPDTIKIISNYAVGFGNIDIHAAKKRGIIVTNTPEVLTDATAEISILLLLVTLQLSLLLSCALSVAGLYKYSPNISTNAFA